MSTETQTKRRRTRSIELAEIREAGGILGVAQKALRQADSLAQHGSKTMGRALSRERIKAACEAADDAQRAINAELRANQ